MSRLLLVSRDVPLAAREAIRQGRLKDAGRLLMDQVGLSCEEVSQLMELDPCSDALAGPASRH